MPGRREFLRHSSLMAGGCLASAWLPSLSRAGGARSRIPLVHCTDLYHPPQDPDDHVDLATIAALPEFDLRGVILDVTRKFLVPKPAGWDIARDPGYVPVVQLSHLLGRSVPVVAGPPDPLNSIEDDLHDRSASDQAAVHFLLDTLESSPDPVYLSVVGSARVPAAAFNRAPELMRAKMAGIVLNAGSTSGTKVEWNVGLDAAAYIRLWRSGLPIFWHPCAVGGNAFNSADERASHWKGSHALLFRDLSPAMRAWFAHALSGSQRGDVIGLLDEPVDASVWGGILKESRDLWSPASLVMLAQRWLTRTTDGWRFLPASSATVAAGWAWRYDPIQASVDEKGIVTFTFPGVRTKHALFGRTPGEEFGAAMAEALGALLGTIAV
jgi:pyrimidine-specific ribonucleoside hydrolase